MTKQRGRPKDRKTHKPRSHIKPALIHTEVKEVIIPDPETKKMVAEMLTLTRETEARTKALFHRIANLQADIATLQNRLKSVVQLLVVRDNPDEIKENEHVIKQFVQGYGEGQSARVRNSPNG